MNATVETQALKIPAPTTNPPIEMFYLRSDPLGRITWVAPDGNSYTLDPANAQPFQWLIVNDDAGKPVMGFYKKPNVDAILVVSIDGAKSIAATLLHAEDDTARRVYYFATDAGNTNALNRPAFVLRAQGFEDSPLEVNANFFVMCVGEVQFI